MTAPAAAQMTGRRAARAVAGFRSQTRSLAPCACVARAPSLMLSALGAAPPTGAQRPSALLDRLADRYTAQRNGQGMF